jgi:hypothetical protein
VLHAGWHKQLPVVHLQNTAGRSSSRWPQQQQLEGLQPHGQGVCAGT